MDEQDIDYQELVSLFADALFEVQKADAAVQTTTEKEAD